jgi:hypothetical protein
MALRRHVPSLARQLRLLHHRLPGYAAPQPGSRPAPELARADHLARERAGLTPVPPAGPDQGAEAPEEQPRRDEIAVLADILNKDGSGRSATETLRAELANADHLGVLGPIWYDLTRRAQITRFTAALRDTLPEQVAEAALADRACTWLWRSLRQAEATGLDGPATLRTAIAARSLTGAREIARVLDSRVRRLTGHRPPAARTTWAEQRPLTDDPGIARYLAGLADAMDQRAQRIGEHAAATQPAWAVLALGPLPADPDTQAAWEQRAAAIGSYRELYGYDSQSDAIGPAPAQTSPEAWADWHAAFAALERIGGIDLRAVSDSQLRLRRASYQRELAWAPPHVADELRLARLQARTGWENAIRADHAARTATDPATTARQHELGRLWHAMHAKAKAITTTLASAQETRRQWAALTEPTRTMALAADLELRRRHPDVKLTPLRSAEPAPTRSSPGTAPWVTQAFTVSPPVTQPRAGTISSIDMQQNATGSPGARRPPELAELDINPSVASRLAEIAKQARLAQQQIDSLAALPQFADAEQSVCTGPAWDVQARRERDAIIQPPKPEIVPSRSVLQRAHARTAEFDAEPEIG